MNEQIKKLAEQAGWDMGDEVDGFTTRLEKFAELVRADEREACAKLCENIAEEFAYEPHDPDPMYCAEAIRKRGEK